MKIQYEHNMTWMRQSNNWSRIWTGFSLPAVVRQLLQCNVVLFGESLLMHYNDITYNNYNLCCTEQNYNAAVELLCRRGYEFKKRHASSPRVLLTETYSNHNIIITLFKCNNCNKFVRNLSINLFRMKYNGYCITSWCNPSDLRNKLIRSTSADNAITRLYNHGFRLMTGYHCPCGVCHKTLYFHYKHVTSHIACINALQAEVQQLQAAHAASKKNCTAEQLLLLQDPVSYNIMTDPLNLDCGHVIDRSTYDKLKPRLCPICRKSIDSIVKSVYAISWLDSLSNTAEVLECKLGAAQDGLAAQTVDYDACVAIVNKYNRSDVEAKAESDSELLNIVNVATILQSPNIARKVVIHDSWSGETLYARDIPCAVIAKYYCRNRSMSFILDHYSDQITQDLMSSLA